MKKYLETFLLSVLLGTSVLLGLAFWLNIKFNFNLFSAHHWNELAKLQVSHTPINIVFYISMGVALFILIFGLYMIFRPRFRKITITNNVNTVESITPIIPEKTTEPQVSRPATFLQQPPKLHLPKNTATIVAQQYQNGVNTTMQQSKTVSNRITIYDSQLSEIFSNNAYLVKPNITIAGFTSNLFAIGKDEVVWIGAVDCDANLFKNAIDRLKTLFTDTLEDIPITIYPFILDNKKIYDTDETIMVFHDIEDIKNTISRNPNPNISDIDKENFDAYSDYIDTVIKYAKNI